MPGRRGRPPGRPTRGDVQPQLGKQPSDLARRHPQRLAEPGGQCHRPGSDLGAGRAQRVGGLARVVGLDPSATRPAAANMELVAGHQRPSGRQVLLVLHRHPLQRQLAAAARAACWQPDRDDPVDVLWRVSVGARAVGRAGLAAGALGGGRGVVLGERGGWRLAARRSASTSARSRSLAAWSRSRSARRRSFSLRSRSRSASSRCRSSRSPAFSSSTRARRQRHPPRPARSRPACTPLACLAIRPEGYNHRIGVKNRASHSARVPVPAPGRAAGRPPGP
jgi:hypothetical protein